MLKSFIVHYSTLSSMESGKLNALHSTVQNVLQTSCTKSWQFHAPQCIINQVYEEWEVTGAFRWTALEPQASLWDHLSQSKACCGSDVLCCLLLWPMFSVVVYSFLWDLMFFISYVLVVKPSGSKVVLLWISGLFAVIAESEDYPQKRQLSKLSL